MLPRKSLSASLLTFSNGCWKPEYTNQNGPFNIIRWLNQALQKKRVWYSIQIVAYVDWCEMNSACQARLRRDILPTMNVVDLKLYLYLVNLMLGWQSWITQRKFYEIPPFLFLLFKKKSKKSIINFIWKIVHHEVSSYFCNFHSFLSPIAHFCHG